jgi:hypothetical protein
LPSVADGLAPAASSATTTPSGVDLGAFMRLLAGALTGYSSTVSQ